MKRIDVNTNTLDDKLFRREFNSLMQVINHRNVVRFLGFCHNTEGEAIKETGSENFVWAQKRERLLCFEYISNGSLDKYITGTTMLHYSISALLFASLSSSVVLLKRSSHIPKITRDRLPLMQFSINCYLFFFVFLL